MALYYVTVLRNLQHSACVPIRARNPEAAQEKLQEKIDHGVPWEDLIKGCDVDEVDFSVSIEAVEEG